MSNDTSYELTGLGLVKVRDMLRRGEISCAELTAACIARISATEGQVQALLGRRDAEALEQARAMDDKRKQEEVDAQPLWGIPMTLKDTMSTKGLTTTGGSKILEGFVPAYDAFCVRKLKEAGAIILGKNNMDEFAMGSSTENSGYHPSYNPWDVSRVPGGSSGGSAASVAARQCFASLGTDTGGSIRQPASLCGCVGVKPTYGRVSRFGVLAYASSLDQVGTLARSVEDAALVLQVIAGHDKQDSTCADLPVPDYLSALAERGDLKGLKLGLPKEYLANAALDPGVAAVCQNAFDTAKKLGAELVEVSLPHAAYAIAAYYIIASAEAGSNLARFDGVRYGFRAKDIKDLTDLYTKTRTEAFGHEVQRRILLGAYVLSAGYYDAYYRKAAQVRRLVRQDFELALQQCDMLISPVTPLTAWANGSVTDPLQLYQMDVFTLPLNMAGLPGLSIPAGLHNGLPVGVQLMGRAFNESLLLQAGNVLTKALGTEGQYAPL